MASISNQKVIFLNQTNFSTIFTSFSFSFQGYFEIVLF